MPHMEMLIGRYTRQKCARVHDAIDEAFPLNTGHSPAAGLMLGQRRRRAQH